MFGKKATNTWANHAQFAHVLCICRMNSRQKWWPKIVQVEFAGKPFVEVVPLDLVSPETSNFFAVPRAEMLHFGTVFTYLGYSSSMDMFMPIPKYKFRSACSYGVVANYRYRCL